jgi:hypothetical protein
MSGHREMSQMMRTLAVYLLTALLVVGACSRGRQEAPPAPWLPLATDARLYTDNAGGIQDSMRTVVRDASTLRLVWQQATAGQASPPSVPAVDFAREMVLVAATGRMTPEDEVRIDSVRVRHETDASGRVEEVMSVLVSTVEGCGHFTAPAFPIDIVRVRRFDGRVTFIDRRQRAAC